MGGLVVVRCFCCSFPEMWSARADNRTIRTSNTGAIAMRLTSDDVTSFLAYSTWYNPTVAYLQSGSILFFSLWAVLFLIRDECSGNDCCPHNIISDPSVIQRLLH